MHWRNQTVGADADIGSANDEVMGFDVGDVRFFVGGDAFVLIMPFCEQEPNGATDELLEVADNDPGVFACEFNITDEGQIVPPYTAEISPRTRASARLWMSKQEPRGKAGRHLQNSSGSGAVMVGGGIAWLAIRVAMPSGAVVVAGWPQALGR